MDSNVPAPQLPQDPYYSDDGGGLFSSKKRILLFLLIILFFSAILLAAIWFIFFRKSDSSKTEDVTLVYWGVWEDIGVLEPIFEEFERENPNITIQYEKKDIKNLGDYIDRIKTRTEGGDGPDIIRFHSSWLLQLNDTLLPFPEDVVKSTGLEDDYFKVVQRDLKRGGAYYGLPISIDTLSLFINTRLLNNIGAQPPATWNDLENLARQLTSIDEQGSMSVSGVAMGTYDNIAHASDVISLLFLQNGADFSNLAGDRVESAISALEFYTLFAKGQASPVWNETLRNSKAAFAGEVLAMYFGFSWDIYEIAAFNSQLEYQIVPVPVLPGTDSTIASYWAEGVSNKTKNPEATFKFMKFLGKNETIQKIFEAQSKSRGVGSPYPKKSLSELIKDNAKVYPFTVRADNAVSTFFASDTFDSGVNEEMNVYLGNAIRGVLNDGVSHKTAIETLANGVNQILSRYGEER